MTQGRHSRCVSFWGRVRRVRPAHCPALLLASGSRRNSHAWGPQLDLSGLEPALAAWRDELARLGPSLLAAPLCPSLARIQELAGEPAAPAPQAAAEAEALVASALRPEASGDAQGPQPAASAASCAGATDDAMAYHDDADTQGVYDGHDGASRTRRRGRGVLLSSWPG